MNYTIESGYWTRKGANEHECMEGDSQDWSRFKEHNDMVLGGRVKFLFGTTPCVGER